MRIAHFSVDGRTAWGVEHGTELIEVPTPNGLAGLLEMPADRLAAAAGLRHARDQVALLCPAAGAGKILGIGMNYHDAVAEAQAAGVVLPADTIWFGRPAGALCGPSDPVWFPRGCDDLDYEGELVIVIGKRCHGLTAEQARNAIGGYAVGNDVTMRRRAFRSPVLGKYYDNQAPVGPVVVTADEIADPQALGVRTWLNGELRQSGNTAGMLMDCAAIVAALSQVMILDPGDIIFTGTPAGIGGLAAPPRFLRPGDVVRVEVDGIGSIENQVVATPSVG